MHLHLHLHRLQRNVLPSVLPSLLPTSLDLNLQVQQVSHVSQLEVRVDEAAAINAEYEGQLARLQVCTAGLLVTFEH